MLAPLAAKEERPFTIRTFHIFKWLEIHGAVIPPMGTILVDESHDLPAPLISLLRRYTDGCIVMGDPYQRLTGRIADDGSAKTLSMNESVRTGGAAIDLVRSVLALHSRPLTLDGLRGSREHFTRRHFYRPNDDLPKTGFRVYGSVWSMLEDALRLKHAGVPFRLLPASELALSLAAQDAIDMRRGSTSTSYYGNREYGSWQDLAGHLDTIGYHLVVRLFEREFGNTNLQVLLSAQSAEDGSYLTLGLLEHCKSLEFGVVTMWPCCFTELDGARRTRNQDELVRAVYLAMTRVRDVLWLPEFALERLTDRVR